MTTIMGRLLQDIIQRGSIDVIEDVQVMCDACGKLHSIYDVCLSDEPPEISLDDAIEALHREAKKIEAIG